MEGERNPREVHLEKEELGIVSRKKKIMREMRLRRTFIQHIRLMTFENDALAADEWCRYLYFLNGIISVTDFPCSYIKQKTCSIGFMNALLNVP